MCDCLDGAPGDGGGSGVVRIHDLDVCGRSHVQPFEECESWEAKESPSGLNWGSTLQNSVRHSSADGSLFTRQLCKITQLQCAAKRS
jgi:hypothetical protein